jgi:uncharacterized Fe-S cluster-containing protein
MAGDNEVMFEKWAHFSHEEMKDKVIRTYRLGCNSETIAIIIHRARTQMTITILSYSRAIYALE